MFEKILHPDNSVTYKNYIYAGGETVAVISRGANAEENYLYTDHLGSVDVVTDKNGKINTFLPMGHLVSDWMPGGKMKLRFG